MMGEGNEQEGRKSLLAFCSALCQLLLESYYFPGCVLGLKDYFSNPQGFLLQILKANDFIKNKESLSSPLVKAYRRSKTFQNKNNLNYYFSFLKVYFHWNKIKRRLEIQNTFYVILFPFIFQQEEYNKIFSNVRQIKPSLSH